MIRNNYYAFSLVIITVLLVWIFVLYVHAFNLRNRLEISQSKIEFYENKLLDCEMPLTEVYVVDKEGNLNTEKWRVSRNSIYAEKKIDDDILTLRICKEVPNSYYGMAIFVDSEKAKLFAINRKMQIKCEIDEEIKKLNADLDKSDN